MRVARPQSVPCSTSIKSGNNTGLEAENNDASPSRLGLLNDKRSLGGSSNADRWFERHNTQAQKYSISFADDDPPFFISDAPSFEALPVPQQLELRQDAGVNTRHSHQPRISLPQLRTDGISAETFRSIVDDLTIEIKELRRRLERHDEVHNSKSENEKLFEVRVYNLEADKKRELEEILHRFASGIFDRKSCGFAANSYGAASPGAKSHGSASSQVSTLDIGSAYASVSASVHSSTLPASDSKHGNIPQFATLKQLNIHSYKKHANRRMQPQDSFAAMTTRAKKKLVVRRLEQLFAGGDFLTGLHTQALQQQNTSHRVTGVEHSAIEASDQQITPGGLRKVPFLNKETEDSVNATATEQLEALGHEAADHHMLRKAAQRHCASQLPDPRPDIRRPGSPLEPDLNHSQLIAENIRYVRRLGFPPDKPPGKEYEWIYLNLLVNMAQLHTLNVTRDFIRRAISELSGHYVISNDGRKVRWKSCWGLAKKRRHSGDSAGKQIDDGIVATDAYKRLKATHNKGSRTSIQTGSQPKRALSSRQSHQGNGNLMYTPFFYHGPAEDVVNCSSGERKTVDVPFIHQVLGESPVANKSHPITASTRKRNERDTGRIIFYKNAQFYTDLSGESVQHEDNKTPSYMGSTLEPVCGEGRSGYAFEQMFENPASLEDTKEDKEPVGPKYLAEGPVSKSMLLGFPLPAATRSIDEVISLRDINLGVTGMGGT